MNAPRWLAEEPWLQDLLHRFVDRLGVPRTRDITLRINSRTIPALFDYSSDTAYRWRLIEQLAADYKILSIELDKRLREFQEPYENARLRLNSASEPLLRDWLDRPREDLELASWREALEPHAGLFPDNGAALLLLRPMLDGCTPRDMIAAFVEVGRLLDRGLSLREISARCFHGHSKFLDTRLDLLHSLFGARVDSILLRPLLLTAWAPREFTQLLIVENQDSFVRLLDTPPPSCALIYSGGFRASADRLMSGHTRFAFMPNSDAGYFHAHWLSPDLPAWFWGDLDFTGLGILKALRGRIARLQAWQPGYSALLALLLRGGGHDPVAAGKAGQRDPGTTGCVYTDDVLLPALRATGRFVDQEAVRV